MIQLQNSNKDILAKLMATEDINVIHKKTSTAYFDVQNRTLVCPILKDDMSPELYDLFMGHEVGHARYTPEEGWHGQVSEHGMVFKGYLNVIEDIRIEKFIKNKYPGLRKSFFAGYKELDKMDFFGLKESGKEISEYGFIDRINLHYKLGSQAQVPFSEDEMVYIKRCDALKTFEEVLELALELFQNRDKETQEKVESMSLEDLQDLMEDLGIDEDDFSEGESMTVELSEDEDEDEDTESEGSSAKSEDDGEDSDSEDGSSDESDSEEETTEDEKASGSIGAESSKEEEIKQKIKDELNKSETDESFRENEETLFEEDPYGFQEKKYFDLPSEIKYGNYIVSYKEIFKYLEENPHNDNIKKYTKNFIDNNKKIVSYMVKEFEMKKAAADYKRSYGAKSGEINMDKLHQYLIKDDIFNRIQVTPEGKNHGMVMIVDWSGSMSGSIRPTIEQSLLLAMFCKRIQIPFRVFAFSDSYDRDTYNAVRNIKDFEEREKELERLSSEKMFGKEINKGEDFYSWSLGTTKLLEIVSDKMNQRDFTKAMEHWLQIGFSIDERYHWDAESSTDWDGQWFVPARLQLGGTPLDHSLVIMRDYLKEFKRQYGIDVMSFIALTDGESHGCFGYGSRGVLVDRQYNKNFEMNGHRPTSKLLKWLKETADVRTIGFYLTGATGNRFFSEAERFSGTKLNSWEKEFVEKRKEYNKISTSFTDGHYDLGIIINQKKIALNYNEDELQVQEDATKGQLKSALVKAGNSKMKQRVILNQFVKQMAV